MCGYVALPYGFDPYLGRDPLHSLLADLVDPHRLHLGIRADLDAGAQAAHGFDDELHGEGVPDLARLHDLLLPLLRDHREQGPLGHVHHEWQAQTAHANVRPRGLQVHEHCRLPRRTEAHARADGEEVQEDDESEGGL